jgi:hypothetical protein
MNIKTTPQGIEYYQIDNPEKIFTDKFTKAGTVSVIRINSKVRWFYPKVGKVKIGDVELLANDFSPIQGMNPAFSSSSRHDLQEITFKKGDPLVIEHDEVISTISIFLKKKQE